MFSEPLPPVSGSDVLSCLVVGCYFQETCHKFVLMKFLENLVMEALAVNFFFSLIKFVWAKQL